MINHFDLRVSGISRCQVSFIWFQVSGVRNSGIEEFRAIEFGLRNAEKIQVTCSVFQISDLVFRISS
jgi:hypothetical protein